MFDKLSSENVMSKEEFELLEPSVRVDLINAQYDLQDKDFPVIVLIAGNDRHGGNEVIHRLNEWMDARYIQTHVFLGRTDEERQRPRFWRYWRDLPPRGRSAIFTGAWSLHAIYERYHDRLDDAAFEKRLAHIRQFESSLVTDGALLLKFWLHLPKDELKKRFRKARKQHHQWAAEGFEWEVYQAYDEVMPIIEDTLEGTHTPECPWRVIDSRDPRHRDMSIARTILEKMAERLNQPKVEVVHRPPPVSEPFAPIVRDYLAEVDLAKDLERPEYKAELAKYQDRLHKLTRKAEENGISSLLVFEGWDAAGKGGVIRRITQAMAVRNFRIVPFGAPTDEERAHHYLWRFWRHLPQAGRMLIYDRSWYGRVLVERVEGFASEAEWQRAYSEINDFEDLLVEHGIVLLKFWLHIDPQEQLARFKAREQTLYKKYKITDEDYRNREKWEDYAIAINDMVALTSTRQAPWHLVPANSKRYARVDVLKTVCSALKKAL